MPRVHSPSTQPGQISVELYWRVTAESLGSKKVALSDKISMTVWYEDSLKKDMSDKNVTATLADVLNRIKAEDTKFDRPVVLEIKNTGNASTETLVKRYYKNDDIAYYAAVLPFADEKTQKAYLKKSYDDGDQRSFRYLSIFSTISDLPSFIWEKLIMTMI